MNLICLLKQRLSRSILLFCIYSNTYMGLKTYVSTIRSTRVTTFFTGIRLKHICISHFYHLEYLNYHLNLLNIVFQNTQVQTIIK
uniref:Uncharacterized protein At2g39680 n=1 Tax=Arabidopsis thaliana TaxID=3702 RepID=O48816_ARATH|nr:unknown protein [Arabidopsis thaliana]